MMRSYKEWDWVPKISGMEIMIEEEAEKCMATGGSPRSSCSSLHEDIFMAGMMVAT